MSQSFHMSHSAMAMGCCALATAYSPSCGPPGGVPYSRFMRHMNRSLNTINC